MAGTASMQPERGQITYARSNFPHLIQLCASKEGPDHIVINQSISSLDGLGQTDLVQKPASGQHFQASPDWMRIRSSMFTGLSGWSYVAKSERAIATGSALKPIALGKLWAGEESRQG